MTTAATAKPKIHAAMNKVNAGLTEITKARDNKQQGFKFRSIDDVYNAVHPLLVAAGIFLRPEARVDEASARTTKSGTPMNYARVLVELSFVADDGSSVSTLMPGEALDMGDKAVSKAISMAVKYALFVTFTIPTDEQDADATTHAATAPAARETPRQPSRVERAKATDENQEPTGVVDETTPWNSDGKHVELTGLEGRINLDDLAQKIADEKDVEILRKWHTDVSKAKAKGLISAESQTEAHELIATRAQILKETPKGDS